MLVARRQEEGGAKLGSLVQAAHADQFVARRLYIQPKRIRLGLCAQIPQHAA